MPQMTDRVTDSKLIELAKQKYEQKQIAKIPGEIVHLTSKGLVYPATSLLRKGYVEMRHMTAYDEDILTNASYVREGIVFDKLLASLIIDDININDIADSFIADTSNRKEDRDYLAGLNKKFFIEFNESS